MITQILRPRGSPRILTKALGEMVCAGGGKGAHSCLATVACPPHSRESKAKEDKQKKIQKKAQLTKRTGRLSNMQFGHLLSLLTTAVDCCYTDSGASV